MKKVKAIAYIRVGTDAQRHGDRQHEELHAKFGDTHQIVAEYRDDASGSSALKLLLEDAAQGKFDVLLCTDITLLTRRLSPEFHEGDSGGRGAGGDGGRGPRWAWLN